MAPAKQRKIAALGGHAAQDQGTGHQWTRAAAIEAGRKGGLASAKARALKASKRA